MQPLTALSLATGTMVLLLGLVVVARERASRISFLFLALTTSVAVWLYSFSLMYATTDPHFALWWAKIAFLGIAFIPTAVYHFVTALARRERRLQSVLRTMWILSAVFAFLIVTTDQIVDGVEHYWWGFYPRYGWASGPYLLFFFFGLGGALWQAIQTWRAPESETERQRMEWVSFSLCVGYLACFDYLPSFGFGVLPFGFVALVGFVVMMGHTVWRYELAEITAGVAAPRILETTRGNIIVTDVRRQIRVISGATHILLGYTDDELVGKPLSLISEEMSSIPIGESNERTPFLFENRDAVWKTRTGESIDMVVSAALISDRRGRAAGILYNGEDVSRRKKEEALRESEVRYRTLIESMREGVMLLNMDSVIQFVNQRMADLLGYVPNELVGKPVYSFINPSSRNQNGETTEMRRRVQMRTMLGRLLWVEVSEAPLSDGKGNIVGSIRVHTDVTDKHQAEAALAESESRYRLLAEFSTDMISRHMADGRLLYASPASRSVLGYEPEELIGTRPAELIHPDDAFVLEKFRLAQNSSGVAALTYRLRRKDGTYVWVESSWRPTRAPNAGDETEVVAVTRDISERKRAEQQIE